MAKQRLRRLSLTTVLLLLTGIITLVLSVSCTNSSSPTPGEATPTASEATPTTSVAVPLPGSEPFPGPDLAQDMWADYEMFLNIAGMTGESTDAQHEDWIDVLSYSHGISQPAAGSISLGGARSAERSQHEDFTIVRQLDKVSPKLSLYCCNGNLITEVRLEVCRASGDKLKFMEYKMNDVIVSSVSPSGSVESGDARPLEEVSFSYGRIEWTYTEIDAETGKPKGNVEAYWDLTTNTGG